MRATGTMPEQQEPQRSTDYPPMLQQLNRPPQPMPGPPHPHHFRPYPFPPSGYPIAPPPVTSSSIPLFPQGMTHGEAHQEYRRGGQSNLGTPLSPARQNHGWFPHPQQSVSEPAGSFFSQHFGHGHHVEKSPKLETDDEAEEDDLAEASRLVLASPRGGLTDNSAFSLLRHHWS
mmetsp:Transcript_13233/g.29093  ORF Transcript_13233/g.29093 Transcript_13233/m.29093 type:complete len:174 (+) Transcript_13233:151-672(+)